MTDFRGIVYLIHFEKPLKHARHYIGFCEFGNLEKRMEQHRKGNGSKLMAAVNEAGIGWEVAKIWENVDRSFERRLKNRNGASRFCPFCKDELKNS